ncbi:M48 family metallopeptidase [Algibacillus agarilyticus]|uniref:M48 family metallopeptidase n=1 Tax=Algibacillus agarilyticus TaxID=2234133 RepID=UPI000DD0B132|nr:M48 family metallopeptidase [Algibacillus agarilyticus]
MSTSYMTNINPEHKKWGMIIFASILITLLLIYKIYSYVIPAASETIANKLPSSVAESVGEETLKTLDEEQLKPTALSEEEQTRLQTLFAQYIPVAEVKKSPAETTHSETDANHDKIALDNEKYSLLFRDWPDTANALALANGTIILTDKMIAIAENDQQLAAVIFHELGHIEHNHSIKNLVQVSIIALTMALLFGDITTLNVILIQGATMSTSLSYSRKAELEADLYATQKMEQHFGSAEEFINVLTLLEQDYLATKNKQASNENDEHTEDDNNFSNWFSSHPSLKTRIAEIKNNSQSH